MTIVKCQFPGCDKTGAFGLGTNKKIKDRSQLCMMHRRLKVLFPERFRELIKLTKAA